MQKTGVVTRATLTPPNEERTNQPIKLNAQWPIVAQLLRSSKVLLHVCRYPLIILFVQSNFLQLNLDTTLISHLSTCGRSGPFRAIAVCRAVDRAIGANDWRNYVSLHMSLRNQARRLDSRTLPLRRNPADTDSTGETPLAARRFQNRSPERSGMTPTPLRARLPPAKSTEARRILADFHALARVADLCRSLSLFLAFRRFFSLADFSVDSRRSRPSAQFQSDLDFLQSMVRMNENTLANTLFLSTDSEIAYLTQSGVLVYWFIGSVSHSHRWS